MAKRKKKKKELSDYARRLDKLADLAGKALDGDTETLVTELSAFSAIANDRGESFSGRGEHGLGLAFLMIADLVGLLSLYVGIKANRDKELKK